MLCLNSARRLALLLLLALCLWLVLWEVLLAPLRPGGSWLVLKALPLAACIIYLARGSNRAYLCSAALLPFYVAEAIVRGWTESGRAAFCAGVALLLALAALGAMWKATRRAVPE